LGTPTHASGLLDTYDPSLPLAFTLAGVFERSIESIFIAE
jgi:DNA-binding XRE family transcriptional regulator